MKGLCLGLLLLLNERDLVLLIKRELLKHGKEVVSGGGGLGRR
jgi:hypothetical protein